jgi:hypothetical protein
LIAEIRKPKKLQILRDFESGQIFAKYGDEIIEGVMGIHLSASDLGAIATLVFPVGDIEIEELEGHLRRVFGATMDSNEGVMPGGN